jgi:pentatricopeptide repeat protein
LAQAYAKAKDFEKALSIYHDLNNSGTSSDEIQLEIAGNLLSIGLYDSCLTILKKCQVFNLPDKQKPTYKRLMDNCRFALSDTNKNQTASVYHQDQRLNSYNADLAPFFVSDSLITLASVQIPELATDGQLNQILEGNSSLYYASKIDTIHWMKTDKIPFNISNEKSFISNGSLSPDKKRFYFTNCVYNWQNKLNCGIYVSQFDGKNWSDPIVVSPDVNSQDFSSTQPTVGITYDNNLEALYFSSNRPGGMGGFDIWYLIYNKKQNQYGVPQNAGSKINTTSDEVSPFCFNDSRTMYFSSNGRPGFGGFDIYSATGELKNWMDPENVKEPLNTSFDDIYFNADSKIKSAFLVSNRHESFSVYNMYCCYDIYYVRFNKPFQVKVSGIVQTQIDPTIGKYLSKGLSLSDSTEINDTLALKVKAKVDVYLLNSQLSDSVIIHSDSTDGSGKYKFYVPANRSVSLTFKENDVPIGQFRINTHRSESDEKNELEVPVKKFSVLPQKPLVVNNIYYAFNQVELSDSARKILDKTLVQLLFEMPDLVVQIASHTDNLGDDRYNLLLSQRRAEYVVRYLAEKGISKKRLSAVGYGENAPIAPNQNADGSDNPSGREKNRRTEFSIIRN